MGDGGELGIRHVSTTANISGCGKTCLLTVYAENRFPEVSTDARTATAFAKNGDGSTLIIIAGIRTHSI